MATIVAAVAMSAAMVAWGLRRNSLSYSGAVAAMIVGTVTMAAGIDLGAVLIFFFVSSSVITKLGHKRKLQVEDGHVVGGGRTAVQVLANGLTGTVLAALYWYYTVFEGHTPCLGAPNGRLITALLCGFLGHYACCIGDTWASELGVLSPHEPRLITTWQRVPAGTNGGMSILGTGASAVGGLSLALVYYTASRIVHSTACNVPVSVIFVGLLCGLIGSLLDSLLGATVQVSYWSTVKKKVVAHPGQGTQHISGLDILDNHQVNFVSSLLTALIMIMAAGTTDVFVWYS